MNQIIGNNMCLDTLSLMEHQKKKSLKVYGEKIREIGIQSGIGNDHRLK